MGYVVAKTLVDQPDGGDFAVIVVAGVLYQELQYRKLEYS